MRRKDREVTDFSEIVAILKRAEVLRLAMHGGDYPYIVPLNFGFSAENRQVTFYVHCAPVGMKLDLLRADPRVAFELDGAHKLEYREKQQMCTYLFESVMGTGTAEFLEDPAEKRAALEAILRQYHRDNVPINWDILPRTTCLKIAVNELTAKRH